MKKEFEKISQNGSETSKASISAMKAFTMTNKRLHPKLYKGNAKVWKGSRLIQTSSKVSLLSIHACPNSFAKYLNNAKFG